MDGNWALPGSPSTSQAAPHGSHNSTPSMIQDRRNPSQRGGLLRGWRAGWLGWAGLGWPDSLVAGCPGWLVVRLVSSLAGWLAWLSWQVGCAAD